jgi:predicted DNA-binding transcriptional regulator YafY
VLDNNNWHLIAYEENMSKIITFALSRIRKIELKNETFTIEKNFDFNRLPYHWPDTIIRKNKIK